MAKTRVAVSRSAAALLLSLFMLGYAPVQPRAGAIEEVPSDQSIAPIPEAEDDIAMLVEVETQADDDADGDSNQVPNDGNSADDEEEVVPPPPGDIVANGACGTCVWFYDVQNQLRILPKDGVSGTLRLIETEEALGENECIWPVAADYLDGVTSIIIAEGVSVEGDAFGMFWFYPNLTSANVAHLDVSRVTNMEGMFMDCSALESLDLSGWDTAGVSIMTNMFSGCSALESVDATGLVTATAENLSGMFSGCSALTNLNTTGWDTRGVQHAESMFEACARLRSLDVTQWNTSHVTDLSGMFRGCSYLTSLDVSGWDVAEVKNMVGTFQGCSFLTSLNLSGWDTARVTSMGSMFQGCARLASISFGDNWNTTGVEDMDSVFSGCGALKALDLSRWDTSAATMMGSLFSGCSKLASLDLSRVSTRQATSVTDMFDRCSSLATVTLGEEFSLRADLGEEGCCRLPGGFWWRSSAGVKYRCDEIPEFTADTYRRERFKNTTTITLGIEKSALPVSVRADKQVVTAANVTVDKADYTSDAVFLNESVDDTSREFTVDASTGAITLPAGTAVGTYPVCLKVVVPENEYYEETSATAIFDVVAKYANPMVVSAKKASVSVVYNAAQAVSAGVNVSAGGAKGKVTYANASTGATAKKFSVNSSTGAVSVPKGTPAGTYEVVVKVSAARSDDYWAKVGKATFKIVVNKAVNPITAKATKASLSVTYKPASSTVTAKNVSVTKAQGTVTYANASTDATAKKFSVNKTTGKVTVPKATKPGTYTVKVRATAAGGTNYKAGSKTVSYKVVVVKAANPMVATAVARTASFNTLKSKSVFVARPMSVAKAQGKLSYAKLASGSSGYLTVNKTTGRVAVRKGTKKGTYTIKIKVTAAGNASYKAGSKTVICKVTVK